MLQRARWYERQRTVFQFQGKADEPRQVFVFSADTHGVETDDTPWATAGKLKDLEAVMSFMSRQAGPADALLVFDL